MILIEIKKEVVDEIYKLGVIKPNEYRAVFQSLIEKELSLNKTKNSGGFSNLGWLKSKDPFEKYGDNPQENILSLAKENPEQLNLEDQDIRTLVVAYTAWKKATLIRDAGDMVRAFPSEKLQVTKDFIIAQEYLTKNKNVLLTIIKGD